MDGTNGLKETTRVTGKDEGVELSTHMTNMLASSDAWRSLFSVI